MNLAKLQAVLSSNQQYAQDILGEQGATHVYNNGLNVSVNPTDYERIMEERLPDKRWTSPGKRPTVTNRFMSYDTPSGRIGIHTEFDCTKE